MRYGAGVVAAMTPPLVVIAALLDGGRAAWGAALGMAMVVLFFGLSVAVVGPVTRLAPELSLAVALTEYGVKMVVLGIVVGGAPESWLGSRTAFAWAVIVGTGGWVAGQAIGIWRTRIPYVDIDL
jgi:ATP synthase protein I